MYIHVTFSGVSFTLQDSILWIDANFLSHILNRKDSWEETFMILTQHE